MRSASAMQVTIRCFGVWNAALVLLAVTLICAAAGWLLTWHDPSAVLGRGVLTALVLVGLGSVFGLVRRQPIVLRWDAQRWHVTDPRCGLNDAEVSDVQIALDVGGWLLLKYRAEPSPRHRGGRRWIPAQRRGMEAQWHSLRCALHAGSAALTSAAAADRQVQRG